MVILLACHLPESEVRSVSPVRVEDGPELLDPVQILTRASLDLRGVRPSIAEIEAVEADPASLDATVDGFLLDERFPGRVRDLYANVFLTRVDSFTITGAAFGLYDEPAFIAAIGDEPLRMIGHIAENDLPYTDLVTADWTMANEVLGAIWPLDYPEGATGWQPARYTDDRPAAGILATNSLWWRFSSTLSNGNRGRANVVSRTLLCSDWLSRPITFDRNVNLLDAGAVSDALQSNPGCVACHYSLEPFAAYFWGFYHYDIYSATDLSSYHPERELWWADHTDVSPGYYGEPGYDLSDLGRQIAEDPRFTSCAARQVFEGLLQREAGLDDTSALLGHAAAFTESGLALRALFASVVRSDEYRARSDTDTRYDNVKMAAPELLASSIEDLTGYRFTYDGWDMMGTDTYGFRVLAGGIDGNFVMRPADEPIATQMLVLERLAEAASWHVVENDRAGSPRLFTEVDFTETPSTDPDAMARQVQALHLRLYGRRVALDGAEVTANLELWDALHEAELDGASAWAGLLSVLLRDPDFLFY